MSWFCNTPAAKKQLEICEANNCPDCEKCIWIFESYNAMTEYGKVIKPKVTKQINERVQEKRDFINKTNSSPRKFGSHEEKVKYIKQLFVKGE